MSSNPLPELAKPGVRHVYPGNLPTLLEWGMNGEQGCRCGSRRNSRSALTRQSSFRLLAKSLFPRLARLGVRVPENLPEFDWFASAESAD